MAQRGNKTRNFSPSGYLNKEQNKLRGRHNQWHWLKSSVKPKLMWALAFTMSVKPWTVPREFFGLAFLLRGEKDKMTSKGTEVATESGWSQHGPRVRGKDLPQVNKLPWKVGSISEHVGGGRGRQRAQRSHCSLEIPFSTTRNQKPSRNGSF